MHLGSKVNAVELWAATAARKPEHAARVHAAVCLLDLLSAVLLFSCPNPISLSKGRIKSATAIGKQLMEDSAGSSNDSSSLPGF